MLCKEGGGLLREWSNMGCSAAHGYEAVGCWGQVPSPYSLFVRGRLRCHPRSRPKRNVPNIIRIRIMPNPSDKVELSRLAEQWTSRISWPDNDGVLIEYAGTPHTTGDRNGIG